MILSGARVVTPEAVLDDGWVCVEDHLIAGIGCGVAPRGVATDLGGRWLLPGFVDIHVHGGGGHSFASPRVESVVDAVTFHQRHGTTSTLLSFVTAPVDEMLATVSRTAALLEDPPPAMHDQVLGIHLEGPYLSVDRCGAQDASSMVDPDPDLTAALLSCGSGTVRVVTLAPERPGALELIGELLAAGVVPAIGHTDATSVQTDEAIRAGAILATHLGNAMRPMHQREPGAFGAFLADEESICELIADGHHLHSTVLDMALRCKGPHGLVLITDAIAAAGAVDGRYRLGALTVEVSDGVARVADGAGAPGRGVLAGSTLTMDQALARVVRNGWPITTASTAASGTPARVLGIDDMVGSIRVGTRADLVVLDHDLGVSAVVARGSVVHQSTGSMPMQRSPASPTPRTRTS